MEQLPDQRGRTETSLLEHCARVGRECANEMGDRLARPSVREVDSRRHRVESRFDAPLESSPTLLRVTLEVFLHDAPCSHLTGFEVRGNRAGVTAVVRRG